MWQVQDPTTQQWLPYSPDLDAQIEEAFQAGRRGCRLQVDGAVFVIDFVYNVQRDAMFGELCVQRTASPQPLNTLSSPLLPNPPLPPPPSVAVAPMAVPVASTLRPNSAPWTPPARHTQQSQMLQSHPMPQQLPSPLQPILFPNEDFWRQQPNPNQKLLHVPNPNPNHRQGKVKGGTDFGQRGLHVPMPTLKPGTPMTVMPGAKAPGNRAPPPATQASATQKSRPVRSIDEDYVRKLISKGDAETVFAVIKAGVDINAFVGKDGLTPLMLAAQYGLERLAEVLAPAAGPQINSLSPDGHGALYFAASNGHDKVVELLLAHGAVADIPDVLGWTPLLAAAMGGFDQVVQSLLRAGADVNHTAASGWTAALLAALHGHDIVLQTLISRGADIAHADESNCTALTYAAWYGHERCVNTLLTSGVEVDYVDLRGWTPLMYAAELGREREAQLLLVHGASHAVRDQYGWSPLLGACSCGSTKVVAQLLAQGTEPNHSDSRGRTPLLCAIENGSDQIVGTLLEKARDICPSYLLIQGADPNAADSKGWTPLMCAAAAGSQRVVQALIECGANIDATSKDFLTAGRYAAAAGHAAIAALLEGSRA
eukprot:TRINITY_DN22702_c0_g1_i1.p1 TRINITY_DN22702_c0_g1~~TRINITY_DN22702_c0_g1_i1.p1  ORF type:complete len:598 (-),score=79.63 TRINITY_DN22702_c0_g1_i1:949-2742(-)